MNHWVRKQVRLGFQQAQSSALGKVYHLEGKASCWDKNMQVVHGSRSDRLEEDKRSIVAGCMQGRRCSSVGDGAVVVVDGS